jgi:hypothetical protein
MLKGADETRSGRSLYSGDPLEENGRLRYLLNIVPQDLLQLLCHDQIQVIAIFGFECYSHCSLDD